MMEQVRMPERVERNFASYPHRLSGGQRSASIAMALSVETEIDDRRCADHGSLDVTTQKQIPH